MKKIQKLYDYLFYTIYRFWEKAPSRWWSEWKSVLTICFFTVQIILAIHSLTMYKLKINLLPKSYIWSIAIGLIVFGTNYYFFLYKDKWKEKINQFKNLDKAADWIGVFLIIIFFVFVIVLSIYSIYLVSKVDWKSVG